MKAIVNLVQTISQNDPSGTLMEILSRVAENIDDRASIVSHIEKIIENQNDVIIKEQLQVITDELKKMVIKGIQENNLDLLKELENELEKQLQEYDIPEEKHNNIKENLKCYILCAISKNDTNFYNNLVLDERLREVKNQNTRNETNINDLISQIREINNVVKQINNFKDDSLIIQSLKPNIDDSTKIIPRIYELNEIERSFENGSNIVFLAGRPGMGKTTLAKLYTIQQVKYKQVYFVKYKNSFYDTIKILANNPKDTNPDDIITYWRNHSDEAGQTLIVIDNFSPNFTCDDIPGTCNKEMNSDFYKSLTEVGVKIIVTTRINNGKNTLNVGAVSDPIKLFESYAGNLQEYEQKLVEEIIKVIHENTLLIILAANIWSRCNDNGKKDLLVKLKECSMKDEYRKLTNYADIDDDIERTLYEQVDAMLDFDDILKAEDYLEVLANAALLPLEGLNKDIFLNMREDRDDNRLQHLINAGWIILETREDKDDNKSQNFINAGNSKNIICLHPLIREILLSKQIVKYDNCKVYCENIGKKIAISKDFENRILFKNCAQEIYNIFGKEKISHIELARLFYSLSDIYDKIGERVLSKQIANTVADNIDIFDDDLIEKALKVSGIVYTWNNNYTGMTELNNAEEILENAFNSLVNMEKEKNTIRYIEAFGKVLSNRGSNNLAKNKYCQETSKKYIDKAIEWHEKALEYRRGQVWRFEDNESIKEIDLNIATSYTTLATDYYYKNDYEQSIKNHMEAIRIRNRYNNWKGITVNQQRIIGCVIERFRTNFEIEESYIEQVMNYYPLLLEKNYEHGNFNALRQNLIYLKQLKKIVLNNVSLAGKIDRFNLIYDNVLKFCNEKAELRQEVEVADK